MVSRLCVCLRVCVCERVSVCVRRTTVDDELLSIIYFTVVRVSRVSRVRVTSQYACA